MTPKTIETTQIAIESKESVPAFPPISIGARGSENDQTVQIVADDRERHIGSQLVRLRDPGYAPYRQAKAKRKKTRQLRILQSLPGVGTDRAKKLLERFRTVRACFAASPAELSEVEGIGSKTAAAIDQVIN